MAFSPGCTSPERPGDPSRNTLDPVTVEIVNKYGMTAKPPVKAHKTPDRQIHDGLAGFISKYRLEAPNTEIKPEFIGEGAKNSSGPIDLANTTSLSSSSSGEESSEYLWRIKHDGAFLNSTSFSSSHSSHLHMNSTQTLRRFNLSSADEGDNSTSTDKVTNHGSHFMESPGKTYSYIGSFTSTPSFQAKLRNMLERVATESSVGGASPARFRPISTSPSVLNECNRDNFPEAEVQNEVKSWHSDKSSSKQVTQQTSRESTSYLTRVASLHIDAPAETDANTVVGEEHETNSRLTQMIVEDAKSEKIEVAKGGKHLSSNEGKSNLGKASNESCNEEVEQSELSKRSNASYAEEHIALGIDVNRSYGDIKAFNRSYDESEFKQMANITHTYQKFSDAKISNSASKVSAIPMSGIGVDFIGVEMSSDFTNGPKVLTPREAAGTACTMSSFVTNLFGKGSVKKKSNVLDVMTMICSPLPDNVIPSPTVHVQSFESGQGTEVSYGDVSSASYHENDNSDNETDNGTHLTLDTYEKMGIASDYDSVESDSSSSESKKMFKPLRDDDDNTIETMSTLTYSKVQSIYGGGRVVAGYHRGPMGGLFASKRVYTPRYNTRQIRGSRYRTPSDEYDDNETQMTMSTYRDDDTQATMSTLTYSKVGSLYGGNAIANYHRGAMGGYYNRNVDAQDYEEDDGWETCSRLTTSTFDIGTKPYRPQNHLANKSYHRGGYYDRRFDSLRECSQSGSESYNSDDDRANTTVTSFTGTHSGS